MSIASKASKRSTQSKGRHYWSAHVRAQKQSALSQHAYCQQHDLAYSTFNRWCRRMREASTRHEPSDVSAFVPVVVEPSPACTELVDSSLCVVLPGGARIEGITEASVSVAIALIAAQ